MMEVWQPRPLRFEVMLHGGCKRGVIFSHTVPAWLAGVAFAPVRANCENKHGHLVS